MEEMTQCVGCYELVPKTATTATGGGQMCAACSANMRLCAGCGKATVAAELRAGRCGRCAAALAQSAQWASSPSYSNDGPSAVTIIRLVLFGLFAVIALARACN
jgi:hypothetical protein